MARADGLRLVGSPGTGKVMAGELSRLAVRGLSRRLPAPRKAGSGMVIYPFDPALADLAVRYHRTSTRALWDLYEVRTDRLEPLYAELVADAADDDRAWRPRRASISISARNVEAFAAGPRQLVGAVKNALIDGARARGIALRVDPRRPDISIAVRMQDDAVVVSVDLGGGSLSQRGYRIDHGDAPLREHLAAAMLMQARWDARTEILLDPMCGSGTICIEGALMARGAPRAPAGDDDGDGDDSGSDRRRGPRARAPHLRLPAFASVRGPRGPLFADTAPAVIGGDADRASCQAAQKNAARAGVAGDVTLVCSEFRHLGPDKVEAMIRRREGVRGPAPTAGVIVSNPPYGRRLDDRDVLRLYRELSAWCDGFRGWRAGFLVCHDGWERAFGRRPRRAVPMRNGPLRGRFYVYDL